MSFSKNVPVIPIALSVFVSSKMTIVYVFTYKLSVKASVKVSLFAYFSLHKGCNTSPLH